MRSLKLVLMLGMLLGMMLALGCSTRFLSPEGTATTVVLIRHAERTLVTKELTDGGHARAAALPEALADLDIVAIYSPNLSRNTDTVKPLAAQRELEINVVDASPDSEAVARRLVTDHPGKTVLWVGNKGNLVRIYSYLGGTGEPPLEYGDLYIMRVPDHGSTQVTKKYFGNQYFD